MSFLWEQVGRRFMFALEAERAHELGMKFLQSGIGPWLAGHGPIFDSQPLKVERFGLRFRNPLGVAAGFDKNGLAVEQLAALGFGFVEVGTVTLRPQQGNERPRLFRLPKDRALINRLGFNNDGAEAVADRLSRVKRDCIIGVNIGRNKDVPNEEAIEDYLSVLEIVHPVADYIAVNVSSPNTPGLRELQKTESLESLVSALQERNSELGPKPLLIKIAPDLSAGEVEAIVGECLAHNVDGLIATNTTVSREKLRTSNVERFGAGGLSGKPLEEISNDVIAHAYRFSRGKLPIIGVGGIFEAQDAFKKVQCGASLLQAYTGFVYGGPGFAKEINAGLAGLVSDAGLSHIEEAIGSLAGAEADRSGPNK